MCDGMEVLRHSLSCGPREVAAATAAIIPGCRAFRERATWRRTGQLGRTLL